MLCSAANVQENRLWIDCCASFHRLRPNRTNWVSQGMWNNEKYGKQNQIECECLCLWFLFFSFSIFFIVLFLRNKESNCIPIVRSSIAFARALGRFNDLFSLSFFLLLFFLSFSVSFSSFSTSKYIFGRIENNRIGPRASRIWNFNFLHVFFLLLIVEKKRKKQEKKNEQKNDR